MRRRMPTKITRDEILDFLKYFGRKGAHVGDLNFSLREPPSITPRWDLRLLRTLSRCPPRV